MRTNREPAFWGQDDDRSTSGLNREGASERSLVMRQRSLPARFDASRRPAQGTGEEDRPRYVISVAAQILELHPQTLRLYEREGLVEPKRTGGKIRLYSERDLERVRCVMRLTNELGVNLAGAEAILNMGERMMEMRREMEEVRRQLEEELETLRRALTWSDDERAG